MKLSLLSFPSPHRNGPPLWRTRHWPQGGCAHDESPRRAAAGCAAKVPSVPVMDNSNHSAGQIEIWLVVSIYD